MNVVFLDVDGELTYSNYENLSTMDIDIEKVKLLKEICDRTGSKVVISSSWREMNGSSFSCYNVLRNILDSNGIDVIGDTPYIEPKYEGNTSSMAAETTLEELEHLKLKHGTGRAAEIQKWINDHDVNNFVILDDEDYDWKDYGYDNHWVQPTWFGDGGLKKKHVEQAVKILNGGDV